jgi:DNA-binding transcriptional MerR regulator
MKREEYVRRMHSRLDVWNNEITELMARRDKMEKSAQAEYETLLHDLRQRRDEMQERLGQVEVASEAAWEDMKAGLELAREAIAQAIDSARTRYK